ncbi:unnamed protein product [Protopolystoma xenopodis]|uniref:Uncharacterized protein n=1 Tax=Protopolystoma xenopodis TaxID=117903 RepID=A0A448XHL1_9PLAT|nr:unnamed protein product [Protopolystoma xenopodis]
MAMAAPNLPARHADRSRLASLHHRTATCIAQSRFCLCRATYADLPRLFKADELPEGELLFATCGLGSRRLCFTRLPLPDSSNNEPLFSHVMGRLAVQVKLMDKIKGLPTWHAFSDFFRYSILGKIN